MTNRQDWHVCELSQAGISSRAYTPGPVLEPRRPALRVRSDDRRSCTRRRTRRARLPQAPRRLAQGCPGDAVSLSDAGSARAYSGGVAVFRGGLKNGVLHHRRGDAVAHGFDRHLDLERRAFGVVRRVDRRQRDHLLQHRRPRRRRRLARPAGRRGRPARRRATRSRRPAAAARAARRCVSTSVQSISRPTICRAGPRRVLVAQRLLADEAALVEADQAAEPHLERRVPLRRRSAPSCC